MTMMQKLQQFNRRRTARGLLPITLQEFRQVRYLH